MKHTPIAAALIGIATSAYSGQVTLGTTQVDLSFSGSLNSVAGSGSLSLGQMTLPIGSNLEDLRITLTDLKTLPAIQAPQSIGFGLLYRYENSSVTDGAGASLANIAGVQIGSSKIVSPFTQFNYSNPFLGLFTNFGQRTPIITGGASWSFGGIDITGSATFQIDALGTLAPVPEANSFQLLLLGLLAVACMIQLQRSPRPDA